MTSNIELSKIMNAMTDRENINFVIGTRSFIPQHMVANYGPTKYKHGYLIDAYFTPPNIIGLAGVSFENNKIRRNNDWFSWVCALSHETLHYVFFKYLGRLCQFKFDKICPKSGEYDTDGFTKRKEKFYDKETF